MVLGRTGGRWLKVNDLGPWLAAKLWIGESTKASMKFHHSWLEPMRNPSRQGAWCCGHNVKGWKLCLAVGFRRDAREKYIFPKCNYTNQKLRRKSTPKNPGSVTMIDSVVKGGHNLELFHSVFQRMKQKVLAWWPGQLRANAKACKHSYKLLTKLVRNAYEKFKHL